MDYIGVDIGGSHISAAVVSRNGDHVKLGEIKEAGVDTYATADEILSSWTEVIRSAAGERKSYFLSVAMPGPFDYENGISLMEDQGKMKSLKGSSVRQLLAESLHISPELIHFTNDAAAFLIGESEVGAGRSYSNSLALTLGTGLGSAIKVEEVVKDAKLWTAPFKEGVAEDYLGTRWFVNMAKSNYNLEISGVKDLLSPEVEDSIRATLFQEFGENLGEFLFPYLIRLHSQAVILGGKISQIASLYLPHTQAYLDRMGIEVQIIISELQENAALVGAMIQHQSKLSNSPLLTQ
ncbi:glucokinase [Algoriphagus faecimaris]|uniref:Glucokinase n=1 Tax=Algoriphagus faecimaris TaxID=686796 RepID=A0A1G6PXY0_9BACT|nr:ROK family protein [Algoriphagus faecimaris]SDC84908.1 glucokinase [Algoriphagus faecimaris]